MFRELIRGILCRFNIKASGKDLRIFNNQKTDAVFIVDLFSENERNSEQITERLFNLYKSKYDCCIYAYRCNKKKDLIKKLKAVRSKSKGRNILLHLNGHSASAVEDGPIEGLWLNNNILPFNEVADFFSEINESCASLVLNLMIMCKSCELFNNVELPYPVICTVEKTGISAFERLKIIYDNMDTYSSLNFQASLNRNNHQRNSFRIIFPNPG